LRTKLPSFKLWPALARERQKTAELREKIRVLEEAALKDTAAILQLRNCNDDLFSRVNDLENRLESMVQEVGVAKEEKSVQEPLVELAIDIRRRNFEHKRKNVHENGYDKSLVLGMCFSREEKSPFGSRSCILIGHGKLSPYSTNANLHF